MNRLFSFLLAIGGLVILISVTVKIPSNHLVKAHSIPQQKQNWMCDIPDGCHISDMSIPGTHDTMTYNGGWLWLVTKPFAQTQALNLEEQLDNGIRFLDIRISQDLLTYHGPVCLNDSLSKVFDTVTGFLDVHPTETVLIRLKDEHKIGSGVYSYKMLPIIEKYKSHLWHQKLSMYLKDLRNKILILNDSEVDFTVNKKVYGIRYSQDMQVIQDNYNSPYVENKLNDAIKLIAQVQHKKFMDDRLYINFLSATALFLSPGLLCKEYKSTNISIHSISKTSRIRDPGHGLSLLRFD